MALIKCSECGREISDRAEACPGCGAPVSVNVREGVSQQSSVPATVSYNRDADTFTGTMILMAKLAMRAVQELGWKLDQANETLGLVTFQTGISWGSWSGVSCSLSIEEVSPNAFRVTGTGKQNVRGGQILALNVGGEAQRKARKAIEKMKELVA
ncbi:MAG: zinc ribbon domain-containing protein [Candidatus Bipolaricaulia bacterium]